MICIPVDNPPLAPLGGCWVVISVQQHGVDRSQQDAADLEAGGYMCCVVYIYICRASRVVDTETT